ncbi:hypothetical protein E2C01_062148 [Portunus trituberculatus]|uniref:Uncharacterized protein n=1 Tax=Portunus trituberculatus TaxID=210409 RepID=A0A5B7H754_PORTR|nr:hypothetical protein [Portunus trituberculatus]
MAITAVAQGSLEAVEVLSGLKIMEDCSKMAVWALAFLALCCGLCSTEGGTTLQHRDEWLTLVRSTTSQGFSQFGTFIAPLCKDSRNTAGEELS